MKNILLSSEYKIIKFLALNGPSTRWDISEKADIEYSTVYSAVKRLIEKLFIAIFDVEKARTGLPKPSYFVTFIGKLVAMAMLENEDDDLDLIATSEPRQFFGFLILDEWEYICQSKVTRNYVLSIIRTKFLDLLRIWEFKHWSDARQYRTLLLYSILWESYPRGGVPRLNDYGRPHGSEILQFFMDNPKLRERIEWILQNKEWQAKSINKEIGEVRQKYGLKIRAGARA